MRARCLLVAVALALTGCPGPNLTPLVSQERAAAALTKWLAEIGLPDPDHGFEKGQQDRIIVTGAYASDRTSTAKYSFAWLDINGFRYTEGGEAKLYTGRGQLSLQLTPDRGWVVDRLAFMSEGGAIIKVFVPKEVIEVGP